MMEVRGGEFLDQGRGNGIGWKYRIQKTKKDATTIIISPSNALHIYYYYDMITTTIT